MSNCDGCYMDLLHENYDERSRCVGRKICEMAFNKGMSNAIDIAMELLTNEQGNTYDCEDCAYNAGIATAISILERVKKECVYG